jgi:hypothetical protein
MPKDEKRVKPVCPDCGGDVTLLTTECQHWDVDDQEWYNDHEHSEEWCNDCDGGIEAKWVPIEEAEAQRLLPLSV